MNIELKEDNRIKDMMEKPFLNASISIIKTQVIKEGSMLYGTRRFSKADEAAEMVKSIFLYAGKEMLVVISLDTKSAPLAVEIVAIGTLDSCIVGMRELFKHAIINNAASIICFHNHPSGIAEESRQDILVTKRMEEAGIILGINLLDHIILGDNSSFVSLREKGYITNQLDKREY